MGVSQETCPPFRETRCCNRSLHAAPLSRVSRMNGGCVKWRGPDTVGYARPQDPLTPGRPVALWPRFDSDSEHGLIVSANRHQSGKYVSTKSAKWQPNGRNVTVDFRPLQASCCLGHISNLTCFPHLTVSPSQIIARCKKIQLKQYIETQTSLRNHSGFPLEIC